MAPNESFRFVLGAIRACREGLKQGFELEIRSEMSHQMGLGSSAAVTVATLAALAGAQGQVPAPECLLECGTKIIRKVQGGVGSGADVAASTYGGCLRFFAETLEVVKLSTTRQWTPERYLAAEHVAPARFHVASEGVVDDHLASLGHERRLAVRCAHFSLIPAIVAQSRLVLTTGRLYCQQHTDRLPVQIIRCPMPFPPLRYYQLWHPRSRVSPALAWFREQVREVARTLHDRGLTG